MVSGYKNPQSQRGFLDWQSARAVEPGNSLWFSDPRKGLSAQIIINHKPSWLRIALLLGSLKKIRNLCLQLGKNSESSSGGERALEQCPDKAQELQEHAHESVANPAFRSIKGSDTPRPLGLPLRELMWMHTEGGGGFWRHI